jgi:hypothetical protein
MVSHDLCIFFGDVCLLIHLYYFFDTMPTEDRNRHKICHCTEDCNRLLGLAQRKNHYRLVGDPTICRSTTPSDLSDVSDDNGLSDSSENGSTEAMDIDEPQDHDSVDIEEMYGAENDHFEIGQEAGDGFYDGSDGEDWEFDPTDEIGGPLLSQDEMQEALEDEMGPEMDLQMWNLRELYAAYFFSQLTMCFSFVQETQ